MSSRPAIAVVLPQLADQLSQSRAPAAEWLLARGSDTGRWRSDWRSWVLRQAGAVPADIRAWPAGPCLRASLDGNWPEGTWLCATPVHLLTGIDHLQLAPFDSLCLDADEAAELFASLDAFLAEVGSQVVPVDGGAWAIRWSGPLQASTHEPAQAAGKDVFDFMPSGPQAARLRSLMNELQMLLHDHPVNTRRARQGKPTVNSLWLWGVGEAPAHGSMRLPELFTDDAWLAGIWRATGSVARPIEPEALRNPASAGQAIVAVGNRSLESVESAVLEPLRDLVSRGGIGVRLLVGERLIELAPHAKWLFWRRPRALGGKPA